MAKPRPESKHQAKASPPKHSSKAKSGAQTSSGPNPFKSYLSNHLKISRQSLHDQKARPVATLLTCSVIGIALVLPTLLFIILANFQGADIKWQDSAQITLFLNTESAEASQKLADQLMERSDVSKTLFLDKEFALNDFENRYQLEGVVSALDRNPLPHAIVVIPASHIVSIETLQQLKAQLETLKAVDSSLLDALWIQRLQSITSFLETSIYVLAIMLAIAVLLILGNTIRLAIENRKEEIAVLKLVGGTNGFVRRPFLYMGVLFGLGGSFIAIILTHTLVYLLSQPILDLAQSYQSNFRLSGLGIDSTLILILCGCLLGWLGAWLAVHRHIDEIEPN